MTDQTPAGWYPDPHDPSRLRWWDGAQWTVHARPIPGGPPSAGPAGQLGGLGFGAWAWIGIAIGSLVSVGGFFLSVNAGFGMAGFGAALLIWLLVLVAGVVLMIWAPGRGLGTGLMVSVALAPIVLFGVCVVMIASPTA